MVANRGEHIAKFTLARGRLADSIGGQQREMQGAGDFDGSSVAGFLLAMKMTLQFHINIAVAKNAGQAFHRAPRFFHAALRQGSGEQTIIAAGETNESIGMLLQFAFTDGALTFLRAQLHLRNQTAKILISGAGRDEERKAERIAD